MKALGDKFKVVIFLTQDIQKGFMALRGQSVSDLKEKAHAQLSKLKPDAATPSADAMVLKVVGANEYLEVGEVLDYECVT